MLEIDGRPILWHIMKHYAHFGYNDFVIALGYKGDYIKKYMVDHCSLASDVTVNLGNGSVQIHDGPRDNWTVELIDTGQATLTGGRMRRLAPYLGTRRSCSRGATGSPMSTFGPWWTFTVRMAGLPR